VYIPSACNTCPPRNLQGCLEETIHPTQPPPSLLYPIQTPLSPATPSHATTATHQSAPTTPSTSLLAPHTHLSPGLLFPSTPNPARTRLPGGGAYGLYDPGRIVLWSACLLYIVVRVLYIVWSVCFTLSGPCALHCVVRVLYIVWSVCFTLSGPCALHCLVRVLYIVYFRLSSRTNICAPPFGSVSCGHLSQIELKFVC
jgi:hypothetical protein